VDIGLCSVYTASENGKAVATTGAILRRRLASAGGGGRRSRGGARSVRRRRISTVDGEVEIVNWPITFASVCGLRVQSNVDALGISVRGYFPNAGTTRRDFAIRRTTTEARVQCRQLAAVSTAGASRIRNREEIDPGRILNWGRRRRRSGGGARGRG
jgi:hypothetical protein